MLWRHNQFFYVIFLYQIKDGTWRKTVIDVRTSNTARLPIRDIAVFDVGDDEAKFGIDIGTVCFA